MSYSVWFLIIPLLLFAIVDSFATLRAALIVAALGAFGEVAFTYYYFGELDSFSIASVFLVLLLCGLALVKESRSIFYLKPALLSFGFGAFLTIAYFLGNHVLLDGFNKYSLAIPVNAEAFAMIGKERMDLLFINMGLTTGVALLAHSVVAAYAALKLSRWWWFAIAGVGVYAFMFLGAIVAVTMSYGAAG